MRPGSYLDDAVTRVPLREHVGKSGAQLERVLLPDGRRLVVKRLDPADDLLMALTGDRSGRELQVWEDGLLDRLPAGVGHAVVDGWRTPDGKAVLVMRDLGATMLTWDDRLDRKAWLFTVARMAALHRAFLADPPLALTPLEPFLGLFAPAAMAPHVGEGNPLPALVLRGWEIFEETAAGDVASAVLSVLADPSPLARALRTRPCTLVHGDMATVNMAIEGERLTLLDWSMPTTAPGAVDLARFVAGCSSVVDASREQMVEDYRTAARDACDEQSLRLALLMGLVWLGWNKALDAAEHPDPAMRDREAADLRWWVNQGRRTLDAGLL